MSHLETESLIISINTYRMYSPVNGDILTLFHLTIKCDALLHDALLGKGYHFIHTWVT